LSYFKGEETGNIIFFFKKKKGLCEKEALERKYNVGGIKKKREVG
jgi:hypothetical protein